MRKIRLLLRASLIAAMLLAAVSSQPTAASDGAPTIGGLGPVTYTEGGPPVPVAPGITITGGGTFADGYIEFGLDGGGAHDRLFLPEVSEPDATDGAVSVVGERVYLGLGGGAYKQIGTVNEADDGREGRPLRVDFSAALPNASFSDGVDGNGHPIGWTIDEQHLTLDPAWVPQTQGRSMNAVSGSAPSYTVSGPGYSFTSDVAYGSGAAQSGWRYEGLQRALDGQGSRVFDSEVVDGALRLYSQDLWCVAGSTQYCSVFGPDAWSTPFDAKAGDDLAFDWSAANGNDDYEVYGYLVDVDNGTHTQLMYGRGKSQPWRTSAGTIPHDGTFRFRFLSGSYDATGGRQTGASLYIDNVRVLSADANAAVAQAVARLVHYEHTGQNPPSEISIGVETTSSGGTTQEEIETEVTLVDDPPVFEEIPDVVFTNTEGPTAFVLQTGVITAVDPEGDPITYSIVDGTPEVTELGGQTYTVHVEGSFGTLHLDGASGRYAFVPNADAIDAVTEPESETFTVTAQSLELVASEAMTVRVAIQASPPGSPTGLAATPDDSAVDLSWTAPTWLGGSPISGYRIEVSDDGGETWTTAVASTGDDSTDHRLSGLTNGVAVQFRVAAINSNGTGVPSAPAGATPVTIPGAPTDLVATPGPSSAELSWSAPADTGGSPISGYRIEKSLDGSTWEVVVADTGDDSTEATVDGLANGVLVHFRVFAITAVGEGPESLDASTTPRTVPGPPVDVSVDPSDGAVTLTWSPPTEDGGAPVSGYRVERSDDGGSTWGVVVADTASTDTELEVDGLTNGEPVRFRVAAINAAGTGAPSQSVLTAARTVPGAPTITSITSGNRMLVVDFAAPDDDGGAEIERYEYSLDGGKTWATASTIRGSSIVVGPVENGITHPVRLRAVNAAGAGPAGNEVSAAAVRAPVLPEDPSEPPAPTGEAVLLVDGLPTPVVITAPSPLTGDLGTPSGTLRLSDGDFEVDLLGLGPDGDPLELDADGRLVIVAGAFAEVSGRGFQVGSTADVWLMSTPIHLGDVLVGADGTFSAKLPIPADVEPGPHTIQLNGVAADGTVRTLSVGVVVRAPQAVTETPAPQPLGVPVGSGAPIDSYGIPANLAFTGSRTYGPVASGLGLLVLGALVTLGSRRRPSAPVRSGR